MFLRKKYLSALWTALFLCAYFVCICLIYPECDFWFYIESEWLTFSLIGVLPFIYFVVPQLNRQWTLAIFVFIFTIRLVTIAHSQGKFHTRLLVVKDIVDNMQARGVSKVIIPLQKENDPLWDKLKMTWGLPVETLIWSTINGKGSVTAVCFPEAEVAEKLKAGQHNKFINAFFTVPYQEINQRYFPFDTTVLYTVSDSSWGLK